MKFAQETLRFLVLFSLVAASVWYSQASFGENSPFAFLEAGVTTEPILPLVCGNHVDWSADGRQILIRHRGEHGSQSRLTLRDLAEPAERIPIDLRDDSTNCGALAPDGRHVLVGSNGGRLWWIDTTGASGPEAVVELTGMLWMTAVAIDESGRLLMAGTNAGSIHIYDLRQRSLRTFDLRENHSAVSSLRLSRDKKRLLAAHHDGRLRLWNLTTGECLRELIAHKGIAKSAEFLFDETKIISAGLDDTIRVWEIESGRELWRGEFGLLGVNTLAVSRDRRMAAWAGNDDRILVWELELCCRRFQIETPASAVFHVSFSPDSKRLAVVGLDDRVRLYDTETAKETTAFAIGTGAD